MRNLYSVFNGLGAPVGPYLKMGAPYFSVSPNNTFVSDGTAPEDRPIVVIDANVGTKIKFRFSSGTGSASQYYAEKSQVGNLSESSAADYVFTMYSLGTGVRVRETPSTSAGIVGVLNKGDGVKATALTVTGGSREWYGVKYGSPSKEGFVAAEYLSKNKPVGTSATTAPEQTTGASKDPAKAEGAPEGDIEVSFLDKYRTPLMLAGAALVIGGIAYYIYSNRDEQSLAMAGAPKRRRKYRR